MGYIPYDKSSRYCLYRWVEKWMDDFDKILGKYLQEEEDEALGIECSLVQAVISARKSKKMTQRQLSERTGIDQADISKIETGSSNPTLNMIKRLAAGMNMIVKIQFVPKDVAEIEQGNSVYQKQKENPNDKSGKEECNFV